MSVNDSITHVETVGRVEEKGLGNPSSTGVVAPASSIRMPLVDALRLYFTSTLKGDPTAANEWSPV